MTRREWIAAGLVLLDAFCIGIALAVTLTVLAARRAPKQEVIVQSELPSPTTPPSLPIASAAIVTPTLQPGRVAAAKSIDASTKAYFPSDYLLNRTYGTIAEARPWTNTSMNLWQYSQELGGVTLWDYFATKFGQGFDEAWDSSHYGWQDDQGNWRHYREEMIKNVQGQNTPSYVIVDRLGTGVVDTMVLTQYSVDARPLDKNPDLAMWGYLSRLGRLRIEVDDKVAYDVPVEDWFSGKSVCLPPELARLFFWRYQDFGSNGSILPVPYREHIKISVYDGIEKPKWFTFTGVTLPEGTQVETFSGCLESAFLDALQSASLNISEPENYIDRVGDTLETEDLVPRGLGSGGVAENDNTRPPYRLELTGEGTITALQFRIPKDYDVTALRLQFRYGKEIAVDMPLVAFFSDQDKLVLHRSTPIGVIDYPGDSNAYLFYSNYPLPFQNGMTIELTTRGARVVIRTRYARSGQVARSQFRAIYSDFREHPPLQPLGADYGVTIPGKGKLVRVLLAVRDQNFDRTRIPAPPPEVFPGTIVFPMGFMESNVTLRDGSGALRIYTGLEDFAGGGYVFGSDERPSNNNLPFAGVLSYQWKPREKGYLTIFKHFDDLSAFRFRQGLALSFQHGTWKNNFPIRYGVTLFYYSDID